MSILHINNENFDELVLRSEKPVLLDFWATWCGPCRMIAPVIEEIAEENDSITVGKIDVDEARELAIRFEIASIPTLLLVDHGKVTATAIGYRPKEDILELLGL